MDLHPSLLGCQLRLNRAQRYIDESHGFMKAFASECEDGIIASYDHNTGTYEPINFPDVDPDLPLAISDAVHNLRTTLDYLVYELALKDSGSVQNGTQFPIETHKIHITPDGNKIGFDTVVDRFLKGVSQPHRDAIELLQPYKTGKWLRTLRDISNPDKHRQLTTIARGDTLTGWTRPDGRGKKLPTGEYIQIDATHSVHIVLPEGNVYVVPTLRNMGMARLAMRFVVSILSSNSDFSTVRQLAPHVPNQQ